MNRIKRFSGTAALVLVLCLQGTPVALAQGRERDIDRDLPQKIVRIIKATIGKIFGGVSSQDDFPVPPRP